MICHVLAMEYCMSERVGCVRSLVLKISADRPMMLLNCKHKSARFYLIILVSSTFN